MAAPDRSGHEHLSEQSACKPVRRFTVPEQGGQTQVRICPLLLHDYRAELFQHRSLLTDDLCLRVANAAKLLNDLQITHRLHRQRGKP